MSRFIIAVNGETYVGIKGWEAYPVFHKGDAYKFTTREGADNYARRNFNEYAIMEVPK